MCIAFVLIRLKCRLELARGTGAGWRVWLLFAANGVPPPTCRTGAPMTTPNPLVHKDAAIVPAPTRLAPTQITPTRLPPTRLAVIDVVRGVAILLMILYHACWDMTFFGLTRFDLFGDTLWLGTRTVILALFLGLVGICLTMAFRDSICWRVVGVRVALLAGCAGLVTVGSWWFTPDAVIFFGVLHHIALASLLGLAFVWLPVWVTALVAALCIGLPELFSHRAFDAEWLRWVGLMTHEPRTNDYVPLLPWFGLVLVGIGLGRLLIDSALSRWGLLLWRWRPTTAPLMLLNWAGRRSLAIYMLHQPLLLGTLYVVVILSGAGAPGGTFVPSGSNVMGSNGSGSNGSGLPERSEGFLGSCQVSCEKSGGTLTRCAGYCRCFATELNVQELWRPFRENRIDEEAKGGLVAIVKDCAAAQTGR